MVLDCRSGQKRMAFDHPSLVERPSLSLDLCPADTDPCGEVWGTDRHTVSIGIHSTERPTHPATDILLNLPKTGACI